MFRRLGNIAAIIISMAVAVGGSTLLNIYGAQWHIYPATVVLFFISLGAVAWLHTMKERFGDFLYNLIEVMWREGAEAFKHGDLEFELHGVATYYLHMLKNVRQRHETVT